MLYCIWRFPDMGYSKWVVLMENPIEMDDFRGTPILRNPHLFMLFLVVFFCWVSQLGSGQPGSTGVQYLLTCNRGRLNMGYTASYSHLMGKKYENGDEPSNFGALFSNTIIFCLLCYSHRVIEDNVCDSSHHCASTNSEVKCVVCGISLDSPRFFRNFWWLVFFQDFVWKLFFDKGYMNYVTMT